MDFMYIPSHCKSLYISQMLSLLTLLPNSLLVSITVLLLYLLVSFLWAFLMWKEEGRTV